MNDNKKIIPQILQTYPMQMQIRPENVEDNKGKFHVKFSSDDFYRNRGCIIPISIFMELLGQVAEHFFQINGDYSKRYLAQVLDFKFDLELYRVSNVEFLVDVSVRQKLGKLYKSHISLSFEGKTYCEGVYVHCNA